MSILNVLLALATVAFGVAGWLFPKWTMDAVDLADKGSTMGLSEVRAASGALFVVAGLGAIWLGAPTAYAMLGFVWLGGALGRATSLALDGRTTRKWGFFCTEIAFGSILTLANLPGANLA